MLYLPRQPRALTAQTQAALCAADGYLYLGMAKAALRELANVEPSRRRDPAVLLTRVRVLLQLARWRAAESLSRRCSVAFPEVEEFTVQHAFVLRQMRRSIEASRALLTAPRWLLRTGVLHYNLACYEAQLGDLATARRCVKAAIRMNAAMRSKFEVDPDLKALRSHDSQLCANLGSFEISKSRALADSASLA